MQILDVGCGTRPRGTVNIDIEHQDVPNFIQCDAHHLPFRSDTFQKTLVHHVLEHVQYPIQVLKEIKRTTNGAVVIAVPNIKSHIAYDEWAPKHLYTWSPASFHNLLAKVFQKFQVVQAPLRLECDTRHRIAKFVNKFLTPLTLFIPVFHKRQMIAVVQIGSENDKA